jgi:hypothetical protein
MAEFNRRDCYFVTVTTTSGDMSAPMATDRIKITDLGEKACSNTLSPRPS